MSRSSVSKMGNAPSRLFLYVSGVAALLATSVSFAFVILDSIVVMDAGVSFASVPITSLVFHGLSLLGLAATLFLRSCTTRSNRSLSRRLLAFSLRVIPGLVAGVLSFSTSAMMLSSDEQLSASSDSDWHYLVPAGCATSAVMLVIQVIFLLACIPQQSASDPSNEDDADDVSLEMVQRSVVVPASKEDIMPGKELSPSPTASYRSINSTKSWSNPVSQNVRPSSSRTRLVPTRISESRDSKDLSEADSIRSLSQSDSFDTWEMTSTVHPQFRDTIMRSTSSLSRPMLEPIPGSRPLTPASPAKLQGAAEFELPPSAPFAQPQLRSTRSLSSLTDESHIHPLFRSDTPDPPMVTSPGTMVTASPLCGRPITAEDANKSRSRSNSYTQSHRRTTRSSSLTRSRSLTPPSREMTPPIPEIKSPIPGFILSASSRESFYDYGKRKEPGHSGDRVD
jgi:hypothetical protein